MAELGSILVVNAGSTSLKLSVVDADENAQTVASLEEAPGDVVAVAHRVVHGGERFLEPILIDDAVEGDLAQLRELAPLHNGPALEAIERTRRALPRLPQAAVFDTAFHATIPEWARTYALPARLRVSGIRRYGFHGLSVAWASERVPVERLIVCHLGGGCSVTAVARGRSIDTTMGFTPLEGVPMATRSGSVDPGALLHLLRSGAESVDSLDHVLEQESGLLGLSGISGGVEELERSSDPRARLALEVYCYRVASAVAAMAVALDGLDALVFTAGVGENSAGVRQAVGDLLGFLGVAIDRERNRTAEPDVEIGRDSSPVRVVVLRAREDVVAARAVRGLLGAVAIA